MNKLLPLLYQDLKRIADREFAREGDMHTLQPTAVLNEALVRIAAVDISWEDRGHFMAIMTTTMRRVLVDHARARLRSKRGGELHRVTLATNLVANSDQTDLLDLDAALTDLGKLDPRKARIVEMHYFGGLKYNEIGAVLELSEASIHRELRFSKAWLKTRLKSHVTHND